MTTSLSPAARAAGFTPAEQDAACHSVSTAVTSPKEDGTADEICAFNIIWARVTGLVDTPGEYVNFTGLSANSTEADFQCTLYAKTVGQEGDGHNCTKPCGSTFPQCGTPTTTVGPQASDSSFPLWAGMLIGLILIGIIGAVAYFMMQKEEKPKKKKRALKVAPPPPPPAPVGTVVSTYTSHPIMAHPMYHQQPVTYAAPAAPIYLAAPVSQPGSYVLGPAQFQNPVATSSMAAPVAQYVSSSVSVPVPAYVSSSVSVPVAGPMSELPVGTTA